MLRFICSIFKGKPKQSASPVIASPVSAPVPQQANPLPSPAPLHQPLINALMAYPRKTLPAETIIYHGSREFSPHTDYANKQITGSRKWFSEHSDYACNYAFYDDSENKNNLGLRLLWVCRLTKDLDSVEGNQFPLAGVSPWRPSQFPSEFPNNFGVYAKASHGLSTPVGFLDHLQNNRFMEVLIADHNQIIEVIDVALLPEDVNQARVDAPALARAILDQAGLLKP